MKMNIQKIASLFLILLTIISSISISVSASSANNSNIENSTILTIDGSLYKFEEINFDGKEITRVTNLSTHTQELIYFDENRGIVFSNNKPVAYVSEETSTENNTLHSISPFTTDPYWTYVETKYYKVTWAKGASIAVVAGAIAAVLPGKSKLSVILALGIGTLGGIAGSAIGGTVKLSLYKHVTPQTAKIELLYEWSFIAPTGETYGPFSYMQT